MKKLMISIILLIFSREKISAQRNCGTIDYQTQILKSYPQLKTRFNNATSPEYFTSKIKDFNEVVTIPVVVHVVYKTAEENISETEIRNQIRILNEDYSGINPDLNNTPSYFKKYIAGDCQIRFELNAITRTLTKRNVFSMNSEYIKYSAYGGIDAGIYTTNKYLNIWIGNITDGSQGQLLGYATFPGQSPAQLDGVVIYYKAFGTPDLMTKFNKGRTATHEVGHWLGLRHIWGDSAPGDPDCEDDGISDTPNQQFSSSGCPEGINISCENGPNGDMYMNYMDYVDDPCMYMFTAKQKDRIRANFLEGGPREDIVRSNTINDISLKNNKIFKNNLNPFITQILDDTITWQPVKGALNYKVSLKPLGEDTIYNYVSKKNTITINGLDETKLYEIKVEAILPNQKEQISSPLLIQANKKEEKILFKE